jgi:NAD+ synthase (glutamine-hydrolysing)
MLPGMKTAPFGFLRVAAACPPLRVADPDYNVDEIAALCRRAEDEGVQVLVFPELSITGYTCGDLFFSLDTLIGRTEDALARLLEQTAKNAALVAVGLPVRHDSQLFNTAAVMQSGRLLGIVPKTFIPGYKEFYEERWFSSSRGVVTVEATVAGQRAPFTPEVLFAVAGEREATIAVEVCEDLWVPLPPSSHHAVAGATVLLNLSASNDVVTKADYRRSLVVNQSARTLGAYVYASCGVHESTTDVVFGGHLLVAENGSLLAEGERFARGPQLLVADIDVERLAVERARQTSFADSVGLLPKPYREVALAPMPAVRRSDLRRRVDPHPFVPSDPHRRDDRCLEIFQIQTAGLAKRLEHTKISRVVLGLSGGLDSTLALLVAARTFELLGLPKQGIQTVTMPGFGTTERTLGHARELASALEVSLQEIDIRAACRQHIEDIGLPADDLASTTFQNLQARERTQILMDIANKDGGLVVGTGDLSELALGWCTFAGDHISMYNVNGGVPKTLVRFLVRWVAEHHVNERARDVLLGILETPVSPELIPPDAQGAIVQKTEELVGPYELHDFFLFHFLRFGVSPAKLAFLAGQAFGAAYEPAIIRHWLRVFVERFFQHQFKRSVLPDGPKVGSVCLSPRGDWRMPSDASVAAWRADLDALEPAPRQAARPRPRTQVTRARNKKKTAPRAASRR